MFGNRVSKKNSESSSESDLHIETKLALHFPHTKVINFESRYTSEY